MDIVSVLALVLIIPACLIIYVLYTRLEELTARMDAERARLEEVRTIAHQRAVELAKLNSLMHVEHEARARTDSLRTGERSISTLRARQRDYFHRAPERSDFQAHDNAAPDDRRSDDSSSSDSSPSSSND